MRFGYLKFKVAGVSSQFLSVFLVTVLSVVGLGGCAGKDVNTTNPEPENVDLFAYNNIIKVDVSFSESDWNSLRFESNVGRGGPIDSCFEYSEFYGVATINGHVFENVNVTKKGTFGSVDSNRPSLKINLEKGDGNDKRQLFDEKRFTLNNNKQDPAIIKQCLTYHIFNLAGIHAPRCNFAKVTAQGKDLGIYTHVEAIKKPFLERTFGNKSGNLYELERNGAFIESRIEYIEAKTNEDETNRAELYRVLDAMAVSDEELWSEMSQVVSMDYLITFAVIEALVGHVDGFTGYQNNVYLYHNPDDQLLYFIPWGADQAFQKQYIVISNDNTPASVLLGNYLMQRLWQSEQFRVSYDLRLQEILDTVWNEVELVAMADKLALIAGANDIEVEKIRKFIIERRSLVAAELDGLTDREGQWLLLPPLSEPPMVCAETD